MLQRVGFWMRAAALAIDLVVIAILSVLANLAMSVEVSTQAEADRLGRLMFYGLVVLYSILEVPLGATPGKLALGLRVGRADGRKADFWTRTLRWNTRTFPFLLIVIGLLTRQPVLELIASIGLWFVFIGCFHASNDWKQAWHDEWAHTAVFRRRDLLPA